MAFLSHVWPEPVRGWERNMRNMFHPYAGIIRIRF
jgi:hypothetical protein